MINVVKAMDKEGSGFAFLLEKFLRFSMETQGWYIWQPSNKRTHEGFSGKQLEYRMWEVYWRVTEEFLPTRGTNVSQTAFSVVTLDQFSKELWTFGGRAKGALSLKNRVMEERYQGRWDVNFLPYWRLKRNAPDNEHRRKSLRRPFIHELFLLCSFQFTKVQCELSLNISCWQPLSRATRRLPFQ